MPSPHVPSILRLFERIFMAWKVLSLATNCAYPAMVVLSESMEPAFSRGDIILLANWQEVDVGDIPVIWFQGQPLPMVHRAVEILFDDGQERLILTKGDNNEINDVVLYPFGQTHRQILVRVFTVFSWIWSNFLILESYHAILSTTFVLLGIDNQKEWPPLFGSITDAWTVQRFWGRFWHRIATPTLTTWTHTILRIKNEPQTTFEKAAVAFGVFFLSAIMHMTAAWRTGEGYVHLDVIFFCANFFAIAVEIAVSRAWMQVVRWAKLKPGAEARLCQASRWFGYLWTFAWFFWMAPRWLYPKTLRWLIKQALAQSHTLL
ncbi:Signal peptidase complex catalytic subunit SEC11 [Colletotrichum fructicola]|nr:Signal peptidase complex catalytic subunit SEC11 [Colletotrichum fructicola]